MNPRAESRDGRWFAETLHPAARLNLKVRRVLCRRRSRFQDIQVLDTDAFGRLLALDGVIQTTEADEHVYHEMLTHVPLVSLPSPRRVLIIGGGDGGILREVLKHRVQSVTLVEIDEDVITLSRRWLPSICQHAFEDPRVKLVIDDGMKFAHRADEQFDAILIDSPDPVGPAKPLFSTEFYRSLARLLHIPGVLVRQTGSIVLQSQEQPQAYQRLRQFFPHVAPYLTAVPTYIAGFFSLIYASNDIDPATVSLEVLEHRCQQAALKTKYYNPRMHLASFALPTQLGERLGLTPRSAVEWAGSPPSAAGKMVPEPQRV